MYYINIYVLFNKIIKLLFRNILSYGNGYNYVKLLQNGFSLNA